MLQFINTLRSRQKGPPFCRQYFQINFCAWKLSNSKFVPKGLIDNIPALVQIMAWRQPGKKPLSEAMMFRSPTQKCGTRPQWVNLLAPERYCSNYKCVFCNILYYLVFSNHQFWLFSQLFVNTLRPRPNSRHFADDIFKCIFVIENVWIPIIISLKFVPKGLINNIPALVQIMAWRRSGDKPLSEPMMVSLLTHICVTRPQWVKAQIK